MREATTRTDPAFEAVSERWTAVMTELREFLDGLFQINVAKRYSGFTGPGKRAERSAFVAGLPLAPRIAVARFGGSVSAGLLPVSISGILATTGLA